MKDIAIIGKGGFGREVRMLIQQINKVENIWNFIGYFDDDGKDPIDGFDHLGGINDINQYDKELSLVIAIGDSFLREKIIQKISNSKIFYPTLIHPSVQMDEEHCKIGYGSIICGNSIVTTNVVIGNYFILNLTCTIGHDVTIGDFCSVMPGVNISGDVNMGNKCFVGTGATIINEKNIGDGVTVGGGAVIIRDVPNYAIVVGNPGKVIRINEPT
ncbi:MAG: sugar O-acyltransferase (sialic acid O-acetyltransferase NeuD family) [Saprospiraceae bacterium]|jgi:sugar O-acyltransferase (sialic acid O-acetyltransferase NeuD family)